MDALKISDITEWLLVNKNEYQKLKTLEFPPLDNQVYWTYFHLQNFIEYCQYFHECHNALKDLKQLLNFDFVEIIKWTKAQEVLGSQKLLMFEINHIYWDEDVNEEVIKIHEDLYTERKPFADIICFCKIFHLLYWDNDVIEADVTEQEQIKIQEKLQNICHEYFVDEEHE